MAETSRKKQLKSKMSALEKQRQPFEAYWRDLLKDLDPRKADFVDDSIFSSTGDGTKKSITRRSDKDMINNRIKQAKRIAVSGMFSGTMSPSKPWFKLETSDRSLMAVGNVRQWLFTVEERLRAKLLQAGFYQAAVPLLSELLDFSTAAMTDMKGPDGLPLFETHVLGSYYVSHNRRGEVDVIALRKSKTARQLHQSYVDKDGSNISVLSEQVRQALRDNKYDESFTIIQIIEPNEDFSNTAGEVDSKFKKFRATTFDPNDHRDILLEDKGFDEFPAYVPRWELIGNEAYGTGGPGMVALGDTRQLQAQEKKKARAIEIMVDPLLKGPPELKNAGIPNNRSNGLIVYDSDLNNTLAPVYQIDPRLGELREDMLGIESRINEAYFVNLFQAISSMQGIQPRNQEEIMLRNEESLLVLGPVLERFQREFLQKMLDRNLQRMLDDDELPEVPEELAGMDLDVRFISTLAQAQRSTEAAINERYLRFTGELAQLKPEVLDKIDADMVMDLQATLTGVNPTMIKDNEVVAEERQARAEAQAQAERAELQQQQASANSQNAAAVRQVAAAANEGANNG